MIYVHVLKAPLPKYSCALNLCFLWIKKMLFREYRISWLLCYWLDTTSKTAFSLLVCYLLRLPPKFYTSITNEEAPKYYNYIKKQQTAGFGLSKPFIFLTSFSLFFDKLWMKRVLWFKTVCPGLRYNKWSQ